MLRSIFLLGLLTASLTLAFAAPSSKHKDTLYNATFDDEVNPSPASLVPVGLDFNLYWDKFFLISPGPTGVQTQSSPNAAAYGVYGDALGGAVTTNPFAVAQAGVMNSTLKSFDLLSFYFGCNANTANADVNVETACTISVQGTYASSGKSSPTAYFTFLPPTGATASPMTLAILPKGFLGLKNATFTTVVSNVTPALTGVLVDNVGYIGYS